MTWAINTSSTVTVVGSPAEVYRVQCVCAGHQVVNYSATDGTNVRSGTVHLTWAASGRYEWSETATADVGDCSAFSLSTVSAGGILYLKAASTSGTWTVNVCGVSYEREA
jgi:hypothetical protein